MLTGTRARTERAGSLFIRICFLLFHFWNQTIMKLTIINSNSEGNCYILESSSGQKLLIECGVQFKKIQQAMRFNFRNTACILTHAHGDHYFAINDLLKLGIDVYSSRGTHTELNTVHHHRAKVCRAENTFTLGEFYVTPFDIKHDIPEPFGYVIDHPESGRILFLTDTYICEYKFTGLNNIIIEANYSVDIITEKLKNDKAFLRDRVIQNHMHIGTTLGVLKANDLRAVNNIVLIHLSNGNSDAAAFKKTVENSTGKTVTVARPGVEIDFNIHPI